MVDLTALEAWNVCLWRFDWLHSADWKLLVRCWPDFFKDRIVGPGKVPLPRQPRQRAAGNAQPLAARASDMIERRSGDIILLSFESPIPDQGDEITKVFDLIKDGLSHGHKRFVVSLARVEALKAPTLGVLNRGTAMCREQGGQLVVCCVQSEQARLVLKLSKLDTFLTICDSEAAALASFDKLVG